MEYLPNGYTLALADGAFPLSTDSMVLAHFTKLPAHARVLDLGSGCGTLGLLLCSRNDSCHVTGIELDEAAHAAALQNISRNQIPDRMESICADLRQIPSLFPSGSFQCCVSNPPYFSAGPASRRLPNARREDLCSLSDLMKAASWALKYGGDFFLVHRPERLGEIIAKAAEHKLEAKRICLLRHREDAPISLILIQLRNGAKPGLLLEETALHHADGTPTESYHSIYHI
jgi:tRNA1(Val) A37 N6-methylase TrmN6